MSRFAVLSDPALSDGDDGDVEYVRGGGGRAKRRGKWDHLLVFVRILFPDPDPPSGGDDVQGAAGDDVQGAAGDDARKDPSRETCVPNGDNLPAIPYSYLSEKVVPFPPFRIRNIRDAKKAAADARSGSYGKASISHGSFSEDGNLQFGFFNKDGNLQFW